MELAEKLDLETITIENFNDEQTKKIFKTDNKTIAFTKPNKIPKFLSNISKGLLFIFLTKIFINIPKQL